MEESIDLLTPSRSSRALPSSRALELAPQAQQLMWLPGVVQEACMTSLRPIWLLGWSCQFPLQALQPAWDSRPEQGQNVAGWLVGARWASLQAWFWMSTGWFWAVVWRPLIYTMLIYFKWTISVIPKLYSIRTYLKKKWHFTRGCSSFCGWQVV